MEVVFRCVCGFCVEICSGVWGNLVIGGVSGGIWIVWLINV